MKNERARSEDLEREVGDDSAAYHMDQEDLMDLIDDAFICELCGSELDALGYCPECDYCEDCGELTDLDGRCEVCVEYDDLQSDLESDTAPAVRKMRRGDE